MTVGALARINVGPTVFFAPTDTAYDRQLVFEFASDRARCREPVRLRIGRDVWIISRVESPERCTSCGAMLSVAYSSRRRSLCARCAWSLLSVVSEIEVARPPVRARPQRRRRGPRNFRP